MNESPDDPENFSSLTESAMSMVEEYGRMYRVANFRVARERCRVRGRDDRVHNSAVIVE